MLLVTRQHTCSIQNVHRISSEPRSYRGSSEGSGGTIRVSGVELQEASESHDDAESYLGLDEKIITRKSF